MAKKAGKANDRAQSPPPDVAVGVDERKDSMDAAPAKEGAPLLSARSAYAADDAKASKRYHSMANSAARERSPSHPSSDGEAPTERAAQSEAHTAYAEHLKSIVYGGLDGIITTFATVTSVAGAQLSPVVVVVLGISHLVADGLSMGTGDAMSSQAEIDLNKTERRRERWEMENDIDGEVSEMVELYVSKGVARPDAETILRTMSRYPRQFLDHMMVEELGLPPPEKDALAPVKAGLITMTSFMLFGSIPLLPYLIALIPFTDALLTESVQLYSSVVTTVLTLFTLGAIKGWVSGDTHKRWWWSGLQMALNGSFAAVLGFIVGWGMGKLVHADEQVPAGAG